METGGQQVVDGIELPVRSYADIVAARKKGRELAERGGFSNRDKTIVVMVISELAENILRHAGEGDILLRLVENHGKHGMVVVAHDEGPGIPHVPSVLRDGGAQSRTFGPGLPGVRRLMDELEIASEVGKGTTVTAAKWKTQECPH